MQIFLAGALVLALIFPLEHALGRIFEADGQLKVATHYYQSWNRKHPEDYESRWHTAELLLATVNPGKAMEAMEAMAEDWPEDPKVLARLVEIEDSLLHVREVIPRLEALARVVPDDPEVLTRLSDHYRWFGENEKLIETLGKLVRLGDRPEERAEFLEILLANRRYDEIIEFYKTYMATMPNQIEARLALYEAYIRTGRVEQAVRELEVALSLDPSRIEVLSELRDQLLFLERWEDAIALYKERLSVDPSNEKLRAELSQMYEDTADLLRVQGKSQAARDLFYKRIELTPKDLPLRLEFAAMHRSSREDAVAIEEIKGLLKLSPQNAAAWLALAERLSWSNQPTLAAESYAKVHAFRPEDVKLHRVLANHLLWAEKSEEALVEFRALLESGGSMADRSVVVELLLDQNRIQEAYQVAKPLLGSLNAKNRELIASAAVQAGHCAEALPQLKWITERQSQNFDAWYNLYECATKEKDPALALRALRVVEQLRKRKALPSP